MVITGSASGQTAPIANTTVADSVTKGQNRTGRELRAAFDIGWIMGISAPDFFVDYRTLLGGTKSGFDAPTSLSFNASSFMFRDVSFGLSIGYYRAIVRETYDYLPKNYLKPTGSQQTVTQDLQLSVIPAMVTVDYFPFERQFTTYVGLGVGFAASHVYWSEVLSNALEPGGRPSGIRYDEWQMAPAVMLKAGVSLGFDKKLALRARAGIYFEGGFLYVPISGPYFAETGKTLAYPVPRTQGDYNIQAGGVLFRVGFSVLLTGN